MDTCDEVACSSQATVYFSGFDGKRCVADRRFCEVHAKPFVADFFDHPPSSAGGGSTSGDGIECVVRATVYDALQAADRHWGGYVFLAENAGNRSLSMSVPADSSWTLRCVLVKEPPTDLPLHQTILDAIHSLGGVLESVTIDAFDEQARKFLAKLRIIQDGQLLLSEIRPSDALIVAALADVPVFVAESLLELTDR